MDMKTVEFSHKLFSLDAADVDTKAGTEVDTDTSSSVSAEAETPSAYLAKEAKAPKPEEFSKRLSQMMDIKLERESDKQPKNQPERPQPFSAEFLSKTRAALVNAAFDGRLACALNDTPTSSHVEEPAPTPALPTLDDLKLKVAQALSKAATEGTLHLDAAAATKEKQPPMSMADFRGQLKGTLSNAVLDGRLQTAVESAKQARCEAEDVAPLIKDTLVKAAMNGNLSKAFAQVRGVEAPPDLLDMGSLRTQLKTTLTNATADGSLNRAFQEQHTQPLEKMRLKLRQEMAQAATDGRLSGLLGEASQERPSAALEQIRVQELYCRVREATEPEPELDYNDVSDDADDDDLDHDVVDLDHDDDASDAEFAAAEGAKLLVDSVCHAAQGPDLTTKARAALETALIDDETSQNDTEDMRLKIRQTMSSAAHSGRLERAFDEIRRSRDSSFALSGESMRKKIQETLSLAAADGRLQATLKDVRPSNSDVKLNEGNLDALRLKMRETLVTAAKGGQLVPALSQVKAVQDESSIEDLRVLSRQTLSQASKTGALSEALAHVLGPKKETNEKVADDLRVKMQRTFADAAKDGRLAKALTDTRGDPFESLRTKVKSTLASAAADGRLEKVMTEVKEENRRVEDSAEALRFKVRDTLLSAAADGRLEAAHREVHEADDLRSKVKQMLLASAGDGRLDSAFKQVREASALEDARLQAQRTFKDAFAGDRLAAAFAQMRGEQQQARQPDANSLKSKLRNVLAQAADDGRLSTALTKVKESQAEQQIQAVTEKARQTLVEAALTGKLTQAFSQVGMRPKEAQEPKTIESDADVECMRQDLKKTFMDALNKDTLRDAFKGVQPQKFVEEPSLEDLRLRARDSLLGAVKDGCLQETLKQVSAAQEASDGNLESLRSQACGVLSQAVNNGNLARALMEVKQQQAAHDTNKEIAEVAKHELPNMDAKASLAKGFACLGAKLKSVFAATALPGAPFALALKEALPRPAAQPSADDALRAKLTASFAGAANSGRLATAMQKVKEEEKLEEIQKKARDVFSSAQLEGRLSSALEEVFGKNSQPASAETEPKLEDTSATKAAAVAKPTSAKGTTRPIHRFGRNSASKPSTPSTASAEATALPALPQSPLQSPSRAQSPAYSSSAKRSRRVFGSIARGPALDLEPSFVAADPASPGRRSLVSTFRMDVVEASTKGDYSYSLENEDFLDDMAEESVSRLRVQPGSKLRSASHASHNQRSAMAMDLDEATSPTSSRSMRPVHSTRVSRSLGAVRVTKSPKLEATSKLPSVSSSIAGEGKLPATPLLPSASRKKSSAATFAAWDMQIGHKAHQWDVSRVCF